MWNFNFWPENRSGWYRNVWCSYWLIWLLTKKCILLLLYGFRGADAAEMSRPYPSAHMRPMPGHHTMGGGPPGMHMGAPGGPGGMLAPGGQPAGLDDLYSMDDILPTPLEGGPQGAGGAKPRLAEAAMRECHAISDRFEVEPLAERKIASHVVLKCKLSQ